MPLLAYNKTAAPLVLPAGNPPPSLPPASSTGARGPAVDVTAELQGLNDAAYSAIMALVFNDQCTFNWSNTIEEFLTGPLLVGLEHHDYYVDVAGDDSNPGTQTQPFATLDAAHNAISALGTHRGRLRIHVGAGTFVSQGGRKFEMSRCSGPYATPLIYEGTPTDELGTLTVTVGDTDALQFTVASAVPGAADDFFGATIISTSGANFGQRRMCVANTAGAGPNTFKVNEQFYFDSIFPGDTFLVQRNASVIQPTGGLWNPSQSLLVGFKYITIDSGAIGWFGSATFLTSVEFRGAFVLSNFLAEVFAGGFGNPWAADGSPNPFAGSSFPAGVYLNNSFMGMSESFCTSAYVCMKDSQINQDNGMYDYAAVFSKNSSIVSNSNATVNHLGPFNIDYTAFNPLVSPGEAVADGSANPNFGAWYFGPGTTVNNFNGIKLENSPTDALGSQNSNVILGTTRNSGPGFVFRPWVIGNTAAGAGISAKQNSQVTNKLSQQAAGVAADATAVGFNNLTGANAGAMNVGDLLEISGSGVGNDGIYTIAAINSPTDVNTTPVPPGGAEVGTITWTLWNCPHLAGASGNILLGGRLNPSGAQVGGLAVTNAQAATPDVNGNRGTNDTALNRASSIEFDPLIGV